MHCTREALVMMIREIKSYKGDTQQGKAKRQTKSEAVEQKRSGVTGQTLGHTLGHTLALGLALGLALATLGVDTGVGDGGRGHWRWRRWAQTQLQTLAKWTLLRWGI